MRICLLAVVLAMLAAPAAKAQDVDFLRCPAGDTQQSLSGFDIFDGPPEQKQDLVPEEDGWELDSYQADNHKLYLVCHYGGADKQFDIPKNIDFCSQEGDNVSCR